LRRRTLFQASAVKVEDLTADEISEIQKWMRADRKWRYLRENENLAVTVRKDNETLESLGVKPEQIASRLASLINSFHHDSVVDRIRSGETIQRVEKRGRVIEDRYFVSVVDDLEYIERQPCYFELLNSPHSFEEFIEINMREGTPERYCKGLARKQYLDYANHRTASATYRIVDLQKKKRLFRNASLEFAAVMIHSIRDHHFFGGSNARMRVDPERLVEFLEMKPGREYTPNRQELDIWYPFTHTSSLTEDRNHSMFIRKHGERAFLQEGLTVYVWVKEAVIVCEDDVSIKEPLVVNDALVDLQGNKVEAGQTIVHLDRISFDIG
jgi:hypothetical protein